MHMLVCILHFNQDTTFNYHHQKNMINTMCILSIVIWILSHTKCSQATGSLACAGWCTSDTGTKTPPWISTTTISRNTKRDTTVERLGPRVTSQRRDFHWSILFFIFHFLPTPVHITSTIIFLQPQKPTKDPQYFSYTFPILVESSLSHWGHIKHLTSWGTCATQSTRVIAIISTIFYQPSPPEPIFKSKHQKHAMTPSWHHYTPYSFPLTPPLTHTGPDSSRLTFQIYFLIL